VSLQEGLSIFKSISIYISIYPLVLCMFNSSDLSCASNNAICIIRSIFPSTVTQLYKFNLSCLYHPSKRAIWITILISISIYSYSFTGCIHYIFNSSSPCHPSRRATFIIELIFSLPCAHNLLFCLWSLVTSFQEGLLYHWINWFSRFTQFTCHSYQFVIIQPYLTLLPLITRESQAAVGVSERVL
jgi:hypothetical protein